MMIKVIFLNKSISAVQLRVWRSNDAHTAAEVHSLLKLHRPYEHVLS